MKDAVYQVITDRMIGLLEAGTVPWRKPWNSVGGFPKNLVSKKEYRGVNVFLLHAASYESPYWLTYKQAAELKGNVRKGEKAMPVVFWNWLDSKTEKTGDGLARKIPFLRYYSVFNVAQCDGITAPEQPGIKREIEPIAAADAIVAAMPGRPVIRDNQSRAFYSPMEDFVGMPARNTFERAEDWHSTLFHELTHATGHKSRCNRKGIDGENGDWSQFGSTPYASEELVAEMGAAFLCGQSGIVELTIDNSASYINSWLERLKDDAKLVVHAAAQAQKAADFILARTFEKEASA